jgi:menaquinone-dependent protoporphyrinogen oxidase
MGSVDTDTSRDYEYTDWDDVRHFTEGFLENLVYERTQDSWGCE